MIVKVQVYSNDIDGLLASIDTAAREFDEKKYGIPPLEIFRSIVYKWLHDKDKELKNG